MKNGKPDLIEMNEGDYVSIIDTSRMMQFDGILRANPKKPFHERTCRVDVIHCIDLNTYEFVHGVASYVIGNEFDLACRMEGMRFYTSEMNYRSLNVNWRKADEKAMERP